LKAEYLKVDWVANSVFFLRRIFFDFAERDSLLNIYLIISKGRSDESEVGPSNDFSTKWSHSWIHKQFVLLSKDAVILVLFTSLWGWLIQSSCVLLNSVWYFCW
jgi:hypothetical protein